MSFPLGPVTTGRVLLDPMQVRHASGAAGSRVYDDCEADVFFRGGVPYAAEISGGEPDHGDGFACFVHLRVSEDFPRRIVDYDGIFELPTQVCEYLEDLGWNCDCVRPSHDLYSEF